MKCFHPRYKVNPSKNPLPGSPRWIKYPCGKCLACQKAKRDEWSYRLTVELQHSGSSFFVTLTYSDENLPVGEYGFQVFKPDVKKFTDKLFKKVRQKQDKYVKENIHFEKSADRHFRYFICSEYGPDTKRPHYHGLFFFPFGSQITLAEFTQEVRRCWSTIPKPIKYLANGAPYTIPLGNVVVDFVNGSRIGYCSKYVLKSLLPDSFRDTWSVMSLRPPIGYQVLQDSELSNYIKRGQPLSVAGFPIATPRYYRSKLVDTIFTQKDFDSMEFQQYAESEQRKIEAFDRWKILNKSDDYNQFIRDFRESAEVSMQINLESQLHRKSTL